MSEILTKLLISDNPFRKEINNEKEDLFITDTFNAGDYDPRILRRSARNKARQQDR